MRFTPIVITRPEFVAGEAEIINDLFGLGLPFLHLRKPDATSDAVMALASQIRPEFRCHVTVHYHHDVAEALGLGGVHLSGVRPTPPCDWTRRVSASCHSLTEVTDRLATCDYVFLSPVYDSVSKTGYASAFSTDTLRRAHEDGIISESVMALGGVTPSRIGELRDVGFGGCAVLGWLWGDGQRDGIISRWSDIRRCCE